MLDRFIGWLSTEPAAALMVFAAAAGVFLFRFRTSTRDWDRRVLEGLGSAALLLALVWGARQALNGTADAFQATHGSAAGLVNQTSYSLWGYPVQQRELVVYEQREVEVRLQTPRADPQAPPEYSTILVSQNVQQNSITRFRGDYHMRLGERVKGSTRYSGYTLDASLDYTLHTDAETETEATFLVNLGYPHATFQDVRVMMDGKPVQLDPQAGNEQITWKAKLRPRRDTTLRVTYTASGAGFFIYEIINDHPINNSLLTLTIDRLPVGQLRYPPEGIAPSEVRPSDDGRGSVLTWKLDRAALWARMGVELPGAEQRGAQVLRALLLSPWTSGLLAGLLAVTMLMAQQRVDFADLTFFLAAYTLEFLALAVVSDVFFGFWGGLAVGGLLALFLAWRWTQKMPARPLLRWLLLGEFALFAVLVPLSSLWARFEQQFTFRVWFQAGLVLLLTGLWLATQRKPSRTSEAA